MIRSLSEYEEMRDAEAKVAKSIYDNWTEDAKQMAIEDTILLEARHDTTTACNNAINVAAMVGISFIGAAFYTGEYLKFFGAAAAQFPMVYLAFGMIFTNWRLQHEARLIKRRRIKQVLEKD